MKIRANGIDIEVEDSAAGALPTDGGAQRPVVVLIMGLGMQLIAWPPQLVQALVDAGYRVIRMDNRDIGLSQHFDHLGKPNIVWAGIKYKLGLPQRPPYTVADMAADALGVLDALGVKQAFRWVAPLQLEAFCRGQLPKGAPRPKEVMKLTYEGTGNACEIQFQHSTFRTANYGATVYPNGVTEITCRVDLD